jgi:hypothetical protein
MSTAEVLRHQIASLNQRRAAIIEKYSKLTGEAMREAESELRVLERAINTHEEHLRELQRG